jgi:hypothetical protein
MELPSGTYLQYPIRLRVSGPKRTRAMLGRHPAADDVQPGRQCGRRVMDQTGVEQPDPRVRPDTEREAERGPDAPDPASEDPGAFIGHEPEFAFETMPPGEPRSRTREAAEDALGDDGPDKDDADPEADENSSEPG